MIRVLVTGATGFVGRPVLEELGALGFEVHAVTRGAVPAEPPSGARFHACDLFDRGQTQALMEALRPTHLLHLAWFVKPGQFWTSLKNLRWVAATLDLYLAFSACGGRRMVGAGTCAEYDWSSADLDEETTPLAPATLYGQSKLATYRLLAGASAHSAVSLAWGRIFFVYGPGEAGGRLVSDVALALAEGREARCSTGTQERDYMHVRDLARAFAALLASDVTGPVNLAAGRTVSVGTIVTTLGRLSGQPSLVRLGALGAAAGPERLVANADILHQQIGFTPRFTLDEGLADTLEWWRSEAARRQRPGAGAGESAGRPPRPD